MNSCIPELEVNTTGDRNAIFVSGNDRKAHAFCHIMVAYSAYSLVMCRGHIPNFVFFGLPENFYDFIYIITINYCDFISLGFPDVASCLLGDVSPEFLCSFLQVYL